MLEKKINHDIEATNQTLAGEGIPATDLGKDAVRSAKGFTRFENAFDNMILSGKKSLLKAGNQK